MFERLRAAWRAFAGPDHDIEKRFSAGGPIIYTGRSGQAVYSPWSADKYATEGYSQNIISYLCIRLISDAFASLPFLYFQGERETPGHPIATLIGRPNPLRGQDRFLQELSVFHLISGNSFVEAVRPRPTQPPRELYNLHPRRMQIIPGPAGLPAVYRLEAAAGRRDWPVDQRYGYADVLHMREPNPLEKGEEFGLAPTQAAAMWIDLDNAGARRRIEHSSGTDPDIAFLFKDIATQEQLDIANAKLRMRWEDTRRAQTPFAIGGNAEIAKLSQSLREMQWTEGMHEAARRICAAWNVPHILVVPGESTYANREMAHLELWEHTVIPFARIMLGDMVPWFRYLYRDDRLDIRIDEDGISALEPRRRSIRESTLAGFKEGMISLNEVRLIWGYEPAVESDDPAEEPAALRNARQASMLAEAQQEALRNPEEQQRPQDADNEDEDEEELDRSEARSAPPVTEPAIYQEPPKPAWQEQPRVPGGKPGAGRWTPVTPEEQFRRWLRTGRKSGEPFPPELKAAADDEAEDFADELPDELLTEEMEPVLRDVVRHFGDSMVGSIGVAISFDIFDPRVVSFLEEFGGDRIRDLVGTTTRAQLGSALADAISRGATFPDIVSSIRQVMQSASELRAETIAITETTRAVGFAGQQAMEQTNTERKRWITSRDNFVRDSHRALDGQTVPVDEPFRGGGIEGFHPGQMSGGAAANVRCRCFVAAIPDENSDQQTDTESKRSDVWRSHDDHVREFESRMIQAARAGFLAQERALVVAAYKRYGNI